MPNDKQNDKLLKDIQTALAEAIENCSTEVASQNSAEKNGPGAETTNKQAPNLGRRGFLGGAAAFGARLAVGGPPSASGFQGTPTTSGNPIPADPFDALRKMAAGLKDPQMHLGANMVKFISLMIGKKSPGPMPPLGHDGLGKETSDSILNSAKAAAEAHKVLHGNAAEALEQIKESPKLTEALKKAFESGKKISGKNAPSPQNILEEVHEAMKMEPAEFQEALVKDSMGEMRTFQQNLRTVENFGGGKIVIEGDQITFDNGETINIDPSEDFKRLERKAQERHAEGNKLFEGCDVEFTETGGRFKISVPRREGEGHIEHRNRVNATIDRFQKHLGDDLLSTSADITPQNSTYSSPEAKDLNKGGKVETKPSGLSRGEFYISVPADVDNASLQMLYAQAVITEHRNSPQR